MTIAQQNTYVLVVVPCTRIVGAVVISFHWQLIKVNLIETRDVHFKMAGTLIRLHICLVRNWATFPTFVNPLKQHANR